MEELRTAIKEPMKVAPTRIVWIHESLEDEGAARKLIHPVGESPTRGVAQLAAVVLSGVWGEVTRQTEARTYKPRRPGGDAGSVAQEASDGWGRNMKRTLQRRYPDPLRAPVTECSAPRWERGTPSLSS